MKRSYHSLALLTLTTIFLSACGIQLPGDSGGAISCTIPCIDANPTATGTVTSASGGTVNVSFHLNGNISDVALVSITLDDTNPYSATSIGTAYAFNPTSNNISIDIPVSSGVTVGTYYPWISLTTTTANGRQYYIDPTKSTAEYTYVEVVSGSSSTPQHSNLAIPVVTVQ